MENFIPIDENVIFTHIPNENKIGSIFTPANSQSNFVEYGRVIAVGPGRVSPCQNVFRMFIPFLPPKRIPMQVKIGDKIYFGRQTAQRIDKYESHNLEAGVEYKILPESRILARVRE